ncbi:hypothetical protein [Halobacterium hubeiense]|uniref:hypothetical protein n=1 Tax=Halobacterium hubeiense TaxID=1407499 RepID=UPI003C78B1AB
MAEETGNDEDFVRNYWDLHDEFWVPERARWDHIKAQDTNNGVALSKALGAVEDVHGASRRDPGRRCLPVTETASPFLSPPGR